MPKMLLILFIAVVPLTGMVVVDAVQTVDSVKNADDFSTKFKITTKRSDDKVDLYPSVDKGSIAIFSIRSPTGISNATIERTESEWKQPIVIRLHLKGLENLRITNGKTILEASVSSHDENSNNLLSSDSSPKDGADGISLEERMELCRNRCFITTSKQDNDLWPFDDRFEEVLSSAEQ